MKQKRYGVNVGSSSLLIIFVVVCLVSFAALSIVSADSDYKLTKRMADRATNYYNACNSAYRALADIDRTLLSIYETSNSEEEFYAQTGYTKSFAYPVSDIQTLRVVIDIHYPANDGDSRYSITEWKLITTGTLEYDQNLLVLQ